MKPIVPVALWSALAGFTAAGAAQTAPAPLLPTLPLSIEAPSSMLTLSPAAISKIYPAANLPEAVFLTGDKKVSLTFEWRRTTLKPGEVGALVNQFPSVIKAQVPGLSNLSAKQISVQGTPWAQFVYTLPSAAGERRRETLITSAQGRLLMLNIDGLQSDYTKNETVVRSFVNAVKLKAN